VAMKRSLAPAQAKAPASKRPRWAEPETFAELVLSLTPSEEYLTGLQKAFDAVDHALKQVFGREAHPLCFGSIVQGVHLDGSDLDLAFDLPGEPPEDEVEMLLPNAKVDNSKQVNALMKLLNGVRGKFRVIEQRTWKNMKVPIIILGYKVGSAEVETDISVGTRFEGVQKGFCDRIIRRVLSHSAKVLHAVRIIKLWTKIEKLNKAFDGYLNSLGWTLLVLQFFLERGELDSVLLHDEEPDECGKDGDPLILPPLLHQPADEDEFGWEEQLAGVPSPAEMADFFEWVGNFELWWPKEQPAGAAEGHGLWAMSLVDGMIIEAPEAKKNWADQADFFLEDPGVKMAKGLTENVARSLKVKTWQATIAKCQQAAAILRSEGDESAQRWLRSLLPHLPQQQANGAPAKAAKVTPPVAAAFGANNAPKAMGVIAPAFAAATGKEAAAAFASSTPKASSAITPSKAAMAAGVIAPQGSKAAAMASVPKAGAAKAGMTKASMAIIPPAGGMKIPPPAKSAQQAGSLASSKPSSKPSSKAPRIASKAATLESPVSKAGLVSAAMKAPPQTDSWHGAGGDSGARIAPTGSKMHAMAPASSKVKGGPGQGGFRPPGRTW